MKREIKFRGYNLKNKMWIYGYYLVNRGKHYIVQDKTAHPFDEASDFEVDPESVGQFVGEYKGKPIYEGDRVKVNETDGYKCQYVGFVVYDYVNSRFAVNKRLQVGGLGGFEKIPITGEKQTGALGMGGSYDFYYKYEVIGNEYETRKDTSNP